MKKRVENQESELPGSAGKTMWPRMEAMWTCLGFWTNEDCFRTLKAYSARNLLQEALICIFLLFLYLGDPSRIRFAFSLNIYIYIYIFFFKEKALVRDFLSLFIYFYLYSKLLHQLKTNTTSTLQLNCKWANYSGHQDIENIRYLQLICALVLPSCY